MPKRIATFLMFDRTAEEAMTLYVSLFAHSEVQEIVRWEAGEAGRQGSIKTARFVVAGHDLMCFDTPVKHEFTFTPAISLFVDCESESELDHAYARLAEGGQVLMPLGGYEFSRKFAWVSDRFGVSWQLNLP